MIVSTESTEETTKHLIKLTREFIKGAGYKVNIQNLIAVLYTSSKRLENTYSRFKRGT